METVAFSLDGESLAIVRQFAKDGGYPSTSSALRQIVREWALFKGAQRPLPIPDGGITTEAQGELARIS